MPRVSLSLPDGTVLASRALTADSMLSRMKGLLGRVRLHTDEALILPRCNSVHTCGMRCVIDVVFVDRAWRIVRLVPQMGPWRMSPWIFRAWAVIELAAGSIQRAGLSVGQQLRVVGLDPTREIWA